MADKYKLGIDIGTYRIVAVLGRKTEIGQWEIVDIVGGQSFGVLRGEIIDKRAVVRGLKKILKAFKDRGYEIPHSVSICIGGSNTKIRTDRNTTITKNVETEFTNDIVKELQTNMTKALKDNHEIDYLVVLSGIRIDKDSFASFPKGIYGKKFTALFHKVYGPVNSVEIYKEVMNECSLKISSLQYKPETVSKLVLTKEDKKDGVLFIDFGEGTTGFAAYRNNVLENVGQLPFGALTIAKDISYKYKCSIKDAALMKFQHGEAYASLISDKYFIAEINNEKKDIQNKELATVVQYRLEELLDGIKYQLQKDNLLPDISKIVITGGGSKLKNIDKLIKSKFGVEVHKAKLDKSLFINELFSRNNTKMEDVDIMTAVASMIKEDQEEKPSIKKMVKGLSNKMFKSLFEK